MTEEQIRQIIREEIIKTLGFSSSIPLPIDQAFRERFSNLLKTFKTYPTSELAPADRDQTTSAGGGDLVPQVFTGLKKVLDPDTNQFIYIAYYQ
jgi:hypothetical protein